MQCTGAADPSIATICCLRLNLQHMSICTVQHLDLYKSRLAYEGHHFYREQDSQQGSVIIEYYGSYLGGWWFHYGVSMCIRSSLCTLKHHVRVVEVPDHRLSKQPCLLLRL